MQDRGPLPGSFIMDPSKYPSMTQNASLLEDVAIMLDITFYEENKGSVMHFLEIAL